MTSRPSSDNIKSVWQSQGALPPLELSAQELRARSQAFRGTLLRRNAREYLAVAIVVAVFAWYAWIFHSTAVRAGCLLSIVGALYAAYQLHRRAAAGVLPEASGMIASVDFYRSELERQRDALNHVTSWYLLPLVPGMAVFLFGQAMGQPPSHWIYFGAMTAVLAAGFWWIARLNRSAARGLQSQIEALDAFTKE